MIAIDPGASGGIAIGLPYHANDILRADSSATAVSMPQTDKDILTAIEKDYSCSTAYLEDLVKYTGNNMPSSSMAVYASNWGIIKGILIARGYRIILVPPKAWQKHLGLGSAKGMSKTDWKNKLKQRAQQLYPKINVTLATADALLILECARRGLLG
jgi:hypothetical protein